MAARSVSLSKRFLVPRALADRDIQERTAAVTSKRQQTQAKMTREREVKERRARKLEKKHAAAAERKAKADDATPHGPSPTAY